MDVAVSETRAALADGDHYREMAGELRELARYTRSPGIRRELVNLAMRYDRRGDHGDAVDRAATELGDLRHIRGALGGSDSLVERGGVELGPSRGRRCRSDEAILRPRAILSV